MYHSKYRCKGSGLLITILYFWYNRTDICSYGNIRLVNGTDPYEGRVEICRLNGAWRTVCDNTWSYSDAKVVCAQLHYPPQGIYHTYYRCQEVIIESLSNNYCVNHTDALALHRAPFGQGNGSILDYINCRGSEFRVVDCPTIDDYFNCNHTEDAGVRCCKS